MSISRTGPSTLAAIVSAAVLLLFFVLTPALLAQGNAATAHVVVIKQMSFNPAQIDARVGNSVEWKNDDIFSHTVTADDGSFDSGLIAPGQSWKFTLKSAGALRYHCRPHPNMKAGVSISTNSKTDGASAGVANAGSQSLRWRPPMSPQEIHPILVNFTAALLPLALLSDLLGRLLRKQSLHHAAWWMLLYEAALTPLTVAAGWWWKHAVGPDLPARLITVHQWLGTCAAVLFIGLAVWRWSFQRRGVAPNVAYLGGAAVVVLALVYQGSLGGRMLFGI